MDVTIEVMIAAMHQTDLSIIDKCNIQTPCLVINQCDKIDYLEEEREYGRVRMISSIERGLSTSRNIALKNSHADICVICDDDIVYRKGYKDMIYSAFKSIPDADVIVFNINSLNPEIRPQERLFTKARRIPKYKTYSSVHIAFKRSSIIDHDIRFDKRFGAGSGMYAMGEDSLFFTKIHKAKLKAYTYPAVIADLSSETSTWFKGYNKKYFYDIGAFLAAAYPHLKELLKFYYPIRFKKLCALSFWEIITCINQGINGYKKGLPYSGEISKGIEGEQKNETLC